MLGERSPGQRVPPASTVTRCRNYVGQVDAHAEAAALQQHVQHERVTRAAARRPARARPLKGRHDGENLPKMVA